MVRDKRRIAAPDNCLSPNAFKVHKTINVVNEEELRIDQRTANDLKPITLHVGMVPNVAGSAYLECGKTKVICSINGPRDVFKKGESSGKGQLHCEFKNAIFSCEERQSYIPTAEEVGISKTIQNALEPVILLHKYPKSRLDVAILVLENDGGAISAAITCAGAALSNAGVEMYDLPIGCSLVHCDSRFLIDPTAEEELYSKSKKSSAKIAIAMMLEYKSQIIFMDSCGYVNQGLLAESMKLLQSSCHQILSDIRAHLKQRAKEVRAIREEKQSLGALSEKTEAQMQVFQPQNFITNFLKNDIRADGRNFTEFRSVIITVGSIGTANGSALVRLGDTSILCGIKCELTNPTTKEPGKGFFVPNVSLTSLCSSRYLPGPPTEQAQIYSQIIMDLWKNSSFLDPKNLCISEGQLAWCLFAEMTCLSYDGNILDACILALMAALRNTVLPEVVLNVENVPIQVTENSLALKVNYFVFSATYSVLGKNVVADPLSSEESVENSTITVFLKDKNETIVHSFGSINSEQLFHCIECSKNRYSEIIALLESLN